MVILIKNMGYIWEQFIKKWTNQFNDAKNILSYMQSYPQSLKCAHIKIPNTANNLENTQKEWLWLLPQFYHKEEIDFFKPYWITIDTFQYKFFMDLSDPQYPIFQAIYYENIRHGWMKKFLFPDISKFLLMIEDKEKISNQVYKASIEHINYIINNDLEDEDIEGEN